MWADPTEKSTLARLVVAGRLPFTVLPLRSITSFWGKLTRNALVVEVTEIAPKFGFWETGQLQSHGRQNRECTVRGPLAGLIHGCSLLFRLPTLRRPSRLPGHRHYRRNMVFVSSSGFQKIQATARARVHLCRSQRGVQTRRTMFWRPFGVQIE
jgi:hypothetical protein